MSETILEKSIFDIHPKVDILARNIKLLTIGVENVISDYGSFEVFAGIPEYLEEMQGVNPNLKMVLLANRERKGFLDVVVAQLPGSIEYLSPDKNQGQKKIPYPRMFKRAQDKYGNPLNLEQAAHIDYRYSTQQSSRLAGFGTFFWTKPAGDHQRLSERLFRPIEFGIIRSGIAVRGAIKEIPSALGLSD